MPKEKTPAAPLLNVYPPYQIIAGTDEAGRGPLCGPVVAAAVILPADYFNTHLNDSKKMTPKKRESVYEDIISNAVAYSVQAVDNNTIDQMNILQASLLAMDRSIQALSVLPDMVLVDGNQFYRSYHLPYTTVIKGDSKYSAIAAASVLAKVQHDRIIMQQHEQYPMYGWDKSMGYGTPAHIAAIQQHGICEFHRVKFCQKFIV